MTIKEATPAGDIVNITLKVGQIPFSEFVDTLEKGSVIDDSLTVVLPLNDFILNTMTTIEAMAYYEQLRGGGND